MTGIRIGELPIGVSDDNANVVFEGEGGIARRQKKSDFLSSVPAVKDTIEAMAAIESPQDGAATQVTTTGRAGLFRWQSGDLSAEVAADPLHGIYVPADGDDGSGGAWVREKDGDGLSPEWFGAVGDGETDDTPAVHAAIDYWERDGGILIVSAVYAISAEKTLSVVGEMRGASWDSGFKIVGDDHRLFEFTAGSYVTIRGFSVDVNRKGKLNAGVISFKDCDYFLLENVHMHDGGDPDGGASPSGVNAVGVSTDNFPSGDKVAKGFIEKCLFERFTKAPINWTTYAVYGAIRDNIVRSNAGNGTAPGIQVNGGSGCLVENNIVSGNEGYGILVAIGGNTPRDISERITVRGNHCFSNGQGDSAEKAGIFVTNPYPGEPGVVMQRFAVEGNYCYENAGEGIRVSATVGGRITGNFVYLNARQGIAALSASGLVIAWNEVKNNNQAQISNVPGVLFRACTGLEACGNIVFDDQAEATQQVDYGFENENTEFFVRACRRGSVGRLVRNTGASLKNGAIEFSLLGIPVASGATEVGLIFTIQDGQAIGVDYTSSLITATGNYSKDNSSGVVTATGGAASVEDESFIYSHRSIVSGGPELNASGSNGRIRLVSPGSDCEWNLAGKLTF